MLLWLNLLALLRRRRLFFLLMAGVSVTTIAGICFCWNYYRGMQAQSAYYSEGRRSYLAAMADARELENKLAVASAHPEVCRVVAVFQNGTDVIYANYIGAPPATTKTTLGQYFVEHGRKDTAAHVILPISLMEQRKLHIGDTYEIDGKGFQILGAGLDWNGIEIPFAALSSYDGLLGVMAVSKTELTGDRQAAFAAFLADTFGTADWELPEAPPTEEVTTEMLLILIVLALGMLNLSYLYLSYLESRRGQFGIYALVGCGKGRLFALLAGEAAALVTLFFLLAVGLAKLLFVLLSHVDAVYAELLLPRDYGGLFFVNIGMALAFLLVQTLRFLAKTPAEMRRRL